MGSIILSGLAIVTTAFLLWRSDRKKAAVGRRYEASNSGKYYGKTELILNREIQLFLAGYLIVEICEIFTVGGFPLNSATRRVCPCDSICGFLF